MPVKRPIIPNVRQFSRILKSFISLPFLFSCQSFVFSGARKYFQHLEFYPLFARREAWLSASFASNSLFCALSVIRSMPKAHFYWPTPSSISSFVSCKLVAPISIALLGALVNCFGKACRLFLSGRHAFCLLSGVGSAPVPRALSNKGMNRNILQAQAALENSSFLLSLSHWACNMSYYPKR